MPVTDELARLRADLDDLTRETRHNTSLVAGAVRKSRLNLATVEHAASIRRLRQPTGLLDWRPRQGEQADPEVQNSLLDRLRRGNPVADSLGNVNVLVGQTNLLSDPTFENVGASPIVVGFAATTIVGGAGGVLWSALKTAPTLATATSGSQYLREDTVNNPFNTAALLVKLVATGAGTHELIVSSNAWASGFIPTLPYLSSAIRVARAFVNNNTNVTSRTLTLEIFDNTAGIVRASAAINLDTVVPISTQTQLAAATLYDGQAWEFNSFIFRIRLTLVTTGATGEASFLVGEPQLGMTYSPDPAPFTPLLAAWNPSVVISYGEPANTLVFQTQVGLADTTNRFDIANTGILRWGSGAAAADLRIRRVAAGWMVVDSNGAAATTNLGVEGTVGQRAVVTVQLPGDTAARAALWGDATAQALELGGGPAARDVRLRRSAAGIAIVDSNGAAAASSLRVEATAAQRASLLVQVAGEANARTALWGDGTLAGLELGSGAAARDLRAYRSAAKILTIDDTAGGAATLNVIGALQQGGVGASLIGHGPADHADITRKLFLPAQNGRTDGATATAIGASPNFTAAAAYADAATQGVVWTFQVPDDWASGVISLQPIWSPGATDAVAHTVRWSITAQTVAAGVTVTAAGTTVTFTGASAARTIGVVVNDTLTSTTLTPAAAGDLFRFTLQRIGADAADTYVGVVNLLGVIVSYTGNQ